MRMPAALLTFVLASAALSGCGSSPKTHLCALSESQATFAPDDASGQVYSVGITAVSLPEIVDRPQLVLRKGGNEIVLEEQHRWAEPLKRALPRVIALNLSRRLGNVRVASHPQNGLSDADYLIALDFHRFEAWHEVEIRLDVSWRVLGTDRKAMTTGALSSSSPQPTIIVMRPWSQRWTAESIDSAYSSPSRSLPRVNAN